MVDVSMTYKHNPSDADLGFRVAIATHLTLACQYASAGDMFEAGQQHALACERGWHVLGAHAELCNTLLIAFIDAQLQLGRMRGTLAHFAGKKAWVQ